MENILSVHSGYRGGEAPLNGSYKYEAMYVYKTPPDSQ